ncbi:hypothetical protein LQT97_14855 [Brucella pseudogrignonensis]|uniref:hypothetical protein n=1 Tax=Brucella pseudogrignonensis TaxID=419475 RepID=UPI001E40359F|nr:hypothetical protein [Brucella pseudogrignonensis]MCD4512504.1 hypothetical protein [Brucella pseudogrignonensis]
MTKEFKTADELVEIIKSRLIALGFDVDVRVVKQDDGWSAIPAISAASREFLHKFEEVRDHYRGQYDLKD